MQTARSFSSFGARTLFFLARCFETKANRRKMFWNCAPHSLTISSMCCGEVLLFVSIPRSFRVCLVALSPSYFSLSLLALSLISSSSSSLAHFKPVCFFHMSRLDPVGLSVNTRLGLDSLSLHSTVLPFCRHLQFDLHNQASRHARLHFVEMRPSSLHLFGT